MTDPCAPGRIIGASTVAAASARRPPATTVRTAALLIGLPLFVGSFQYVIDAPPAYLLSKAWPVLTAPLAIWAALRLSPCFLPLLLGACAWLMAFAAFISVAQLGNDAVGALAASVKIWPLSGALGGLACLTLMRPTDDDMRRAICILAAATFGFLIGAWVLAPSSAFEKGIEHTKVFLSDPERGRRINAPSMFAILGLFALNRAFWRRPAVWKAALMLAGLLTLMLIYKQRAQIAGTVIGLVLGAVLSMKRWRAPAFAALLALILATAVPAWLWLQDSVIESLGGSLSMRQEEARAAVAFLNAEPWRWITGVGSTTRIGEVSLGDIVGMDFFFLSDLGWLGVVFEYGLIGAALMLALHLTAIRLCWNAARSGAPLQQALFDYSLFLLVVSPIVSVVLSPGELATCLALGAWWAGGLRQNTSDPAICRVRVRRMIRTSSCSDQLRI